MRDGGIRGDIGGIGWGEGEEMKEGYCSNIRIISITVIDCCPAAVQVASLKGPPIIKY